MLWEKRRGEESLPLFSRGRIKPLIFKSYLSLQWAPLLLTRNQPTGFALRFGLLVLIERWAGVWTEFLWFGEPSGPPGLRSLIHQEFGYKFPKYLTQHLSHFNVQVGLALESWRWVRVLHFQHSPLWGGSCWSKAHTLNDKQLRSVLLTGINPTNYRKDPHWTNSLLRELNCFLEQQRLPGFTQLWCTPSFILKDRAIPYLNTFSFRF